MRDREKVDGTTYALRFGCGTLFGAALGFGLLCVVRRVARIDVFEALWRDRDGARAIIAVVALVFAVLATRYGDRAYELVLRYLSYCLRSRSRSRFRD